MNCEKHPGIETNITCAECDRPICPKCMVYTPVGVKCAECARQRGRSVGGPRPIYYARAAVAGLSSAVIGGVLLFETVRLFRFGGFIFVMGLGLVIGEVVSRGAGRNTSVGLQVIAASSAALAFLIAGYFTGYPVLTAGGWNGLVFGQVNAFRLLLGLLGTYMATLRLKD